MTRKLKRAAEFEVALEILEAGAVILAGPLAGDLPGKVGLAHLPWADEQDHFFGKVPLDEIMLKSFHVTILQSNAE